MRANEYFRKHGYKHCKSACLQNGWLNTGFWINLKRYVDAYELVQSYGGLSMAKRQHSCFVGASKSVGANQSDRVIALGRAITLVEECQ